MPVGARHAALPTASRPNSVAPQLCCLGVASLQSGAAAVVALMKLHRVSCPSGRGMPRPQQRRARTAPRPNSVAPEQRRARTASRWRGVAAIRRCRSCRSDKASSRLMPVGARHAAPEQRRARTASRPNSAAPEQRRARTAPRWRGVAAIRRCRSCRSNEASSRLMPVGARHAAPEQRRARTAPCPNSAAPEQRRAGAASLQSGAAAVVALMKLHRVSCPSGRGMPRPNSVAPEQRRARTASRPNCVALAWRRCNSALPQLSL
jgi:hypothetical protein